MKYRVNNPTNPNDSSWFITFDMNDKRTRVPKKLIIKCNTRASLSPASPSPANREKNSIRSKGNRFCDKAEKLISQKRQFRKSARVPRYLYDNLSSSETSYHISLFRDASALIVIIVVIAANVTDVADYISDSIDLAFGGLKISRYLFQFFDIDASKRCIY